MVDPHLEVLAIGAGLLARLHQVLLELVTVSLERRIHGLEELLAIARLLARLQRGEGWWSGD